MIIVALPHRVKYIPVSSVPNRAASSNIHIAHRAFAAMPALRSLALGACAAAVQALDPQNRPTSLSAASTSRADAEFELTLDHILFGVMSSAIRSRRARAVKATWCSAERIKCVFFSESAETAKEVQPVVAIQVRPPSPLAGVSDRFAARRARVSDSTRRPSCHVPLTSRHRISTPTTRARSSNSSRRFNS